MRAICQIKMGEVGRYVHCGGAGWGDKRCSILCLGQWMMPLFALLLVWSLVSWLID